MLNRPMFYRVIGALSMIIGGLGMYMKHDGAYTLLVHGVLNTVIADVIELKQKQERH